MKEERKQGKNEIKVQEKEKGKAKQGRQERKHIKAQEKGKGNRQTKAEQSGQEKKRTKAQGKKEENRQIKAGQSEQEKKRTKVQGRKEENRQIKAEQSEQQKERIKAQGKKEENGQIKAEQSGQEKKYVKAQDKEKGNRQSSVLKNGEEKQCTKVQQVGQEDEAQTEKKQKRDWKEYIYNCPYLLVITLTSLVVMFHSEEIGIGAIASRAQISASESYAKMPEEQEIFSGELIKNDINTGDMNDMEADEGTAGEDDMQSDQPAADTEENSSENLEDAGQCREDNDDLQDDNKLQEDDGNSESTVKSEEKPKGVTRFEYYDPVPIESRYYKDAGKIALTTEYPYTKEDISYFNDAAFLGDSRTLGISDYAGLEEADFYCDSGMTIFKILEEGVTYQKTGDKVYMTEVLQEKQYGKIYIMLGMNELGYGDTEFYLDQYRQVLQQIREWQPDAVIYVMANLHVSREKNNMETEFNNLNINAKNAASASLANGTDVFYLDVNPIFTDEEGYLNAELTFDGVHLYAKHYDAWREFLLEHAVEPEE